MHELQTKTAFVARNMILNKREIVFLKSFSEIGFNDFPDIGELTLQPNPIGTEVQDQITDGQTVPSDLVASHESVLQQLNYENES